MVGLCSQFWCVTADDVYRVGGGWGGKERKGGGQAEERGGCSACVCVFVVRVCVEGGGWVGWGVEEGSQHHLCSDARQQLLLPCAPPIFLHVLLLLCSVAVVPTGQHLLP